MPQTANGQKTPAKAARSEQRVYRPGQRQRERMQRLARRRKRQRIIGGTIAAILVITVGIIGTVWYQNYSAQVAATNSAHATGTARVKDARATATANVIATATATVVMRDCFVSPSGTAVPAIYDGTATPTAGPSTAPAITGTPVTLKDGLKYVDIKVGTGPAVTSGKTVSVNYTGWLATTCKKFDSSYDSHTDQSGNSQPPQPFSFPLGQGQVIKGWDEGLVGMKAGGIRRLYIPPALGYGAQGSGPIPANTALIFDVQLISFK
jgi:hypothetical protein